MIYMPCVVNNLAQIIICTMDILIRGTLNVYINSVNAFYFVFRTIDSKVDNM